MSDNQTTYSCPDCDKVFTTMSALGPHRNKAHGFRKADGKNHPALVQAAQKSARMAAQASKQARAVQKWRKGHAGKFPCDQCDFVASWGGGLKKHQRAAHPSPEQITERNVQLATRPTAVSQAPSTRVNGYHSVEAEARGNLVTEAAIALATGRVQELLTSIAFQLDIPAKSLTARVIELVHATTLR